MTEKRDLEMNGSFSTCLIKRKRANAIIFLWDMDLRKMRFRTQWLFVAT